MSGRDVHRNAGLRDALFLCNRSPRFNAIASIEWASRLSTILGVSSCALTPFLLRLDNLAEIKLMADEESYMAAERPVPWSIPEALLLWLVFPGVQFFSSLLLGVVVGMSSGFTAGGMPDIPGWMLIISSAAGHVATIILLWTIIRVFYRMPFLEGIRWGGKKNLIKLSVGLGIATAVLNGAFTFLFPPPETAEIPMLEMLATRTDLTVFSVFAIVIAPFVEEFLFRGWIYPTFEKKLGVVWAVLITSALFAAPHLLQLGAYKIGVLLVGFMGAVACILRAATGGVRAPYFFHLAYNVFLVLMEVLNRAGTTGKT